jgi:hypothetical protein
MAKLDMESATTFMEHLTDMVRKMKSVPVELPNKINKVQLFFRLYCKLQRVLNELTTQIKDTTMVYDLGKISWTLFICTKRNLHPELKLADQPILLKQAILFVGKLLGLCLHELILNKLFEK